jgi:hypothetical protein
LQACFQVYQVLQALAHDAVVIDQQDILHNDCLVLERLERLVLEFTANWNGQKHHAIVL